MKFFKLEKMNFDLFGDIDPFAILEGDFLEDTFAMGLFGKHQGYDYPIGLGLGL